MLKPRLQVTFTTEELVALAELARQEGRDVRAQIRQCAIEALRKRGLLLWANEQREEVYHPDNRAHPTL